MKINNKLLAKSIQDVLQETAGSGIPACLMNDLDSITDPFLEETQSIQDYFRRRVICQYVVDSVLEFLAENYYNDSEDGFENICDESTENNSYLWPMIKDMIQKILDVEIVYTDFCAIIDQSFEKYLKICHDSKATSFFNDEMVTYTYQIYEKWKDSQNSKSPTAN